MLVSFSFLQITFIADIFHSSFNCLCIVNLSMYHDQMDIADVPCYCQFFLFFFIFLMQSLCMIEIVVNTYIKLIQNPSAEC